MKNISLFLFACVLSLGGFAQNGITFKVEELSKPEALLEPIPYKDVWKRFVLWGNGIEHYQAEFSQIEIPYNIVAWSNAPDSLITYDLHPFFYGMYRAYADHRPWVLSPDMIWLLICQGFSHHVNINAERLRNYFVDFEGKKKLIVYATPEISLDNPNAPWEKIFAEFTNLISANLGDDLVEILSADFSTTTSIEKAACEITIMDAMKSYFEYQVSIICGIPEITLRGTAEDWEKILRKTKALAKYDLQWWTSELEPILEKMIETSKGEIDTSFWMNMFKRHTPERYAVTEEFDGWIIKFFPYDVYGHKNNLRKITDIRKQLHSEVVKVEMVFEDITKLKTDTLELWAGFIGLEQNAVNFALTPKIGWMIRKKDSTPNTLDTLQKNDKKWWRFDNPEPKTISRYLSLEMDEENMLEGVIVRFRGKIAIPDDVVEIKLTERLLLEGEITDDEIQILKNRFPTIHLVINGKTITTK